MSTSSTSIDVQVCRRHHHRNRRNSSNRRQIDASAVKLFPFPLPLSFMKDKIKQNDSSEAEAKPSFLSRYQPSKSRILVKVSAVNACVDELKTQVVKDLHECLFVRVVNVGPNVEDPDHVRPGALIVILKNSGQKLVNLSRIEKREYRMIKESHILAYADF